MIKYFTDLLSNGKTDAAEVVGIVFLVFFALIGLWVFQRIVKDVWATPGFRSKKKELLQHDFFISYSRIKNAIQTFRVQNDELTEIFKIVVSAKLRVVYGNTKRFIESQNWTTINHRDLEEQVFNLLREMVKNYNADILKSLQQKYGNSKGHEVYEYVMNAPAIGFNQWHATNIRHIENMVASILDAKVIKGPCHKMQIILHELLFGLHSGVIDAEKAFFSFNGKLQAILGKPNN